jgi:NADH-quinone oxidoreductase subunit N
MNPSHLSFYLPALPQIVLLCGIVVTLLVDVFLPKNLKGITYLLAQLSLVASFVALWCHGTGGHTFNGQFVMDHLSRVLVSGVLVLAFIVFLHGRSYVLSHKIMRGEFYLLALISILGAQVLICANSLLLLYLGLELLSLPMYALVAIRRDHANGAESAMKYFVMGALASGVLLYGMSLVYGLTGSINLQAIALHVVHQVHQLPMLFAIVLMLAGIAFKFAAVPFHFWAPDVYEGAPLCTTALIGTVSKLAAFALLYRVVDVAFPAYQMHWHQVLFALAMISIVVGNLVALVQTNTLRMLAYSTISHMGFIMLALGLASPMGVHYALFYTLVYGLTSAAAFGLMMLLSQRHDFAHIESFKGLSTRNPWFAWMMLLIMFSMAGVPPLVGFTAKFSIILAVAQHHHYIMAIIALVMSVVAAGYYLRIVKFMFFDEPMDITPITSSVDNRVAVSLNAIALLALGLYPSILLHWIV